MSHTHTKSVSHTTCVQLGSHTNMASHPRPDAVGVFNKLTHSRSTAKTCQLCTQHEATHWSQTPPPSLTHTRAPHPPPSPRLCVALCRCVIAHAHMDRHACMPMATEHMHMSSRCCNRQCATCDSRAGSSRCGVDFVLLHARVRSRRLPADHHKPTKKACQQCPHKNTHTYIWYYDSCTAQNASNVPTPFPPPTHTTQGHLQLDRPRLDTHPWSACPLAPPRGGHTPASLGFRV